MSENGTSWSNIKGGAIKSGKSLKIQKIRKNEKNIYSIFMFNRELAHTICYGVWFVFWKAAMLSKHITDEISQKFDHPPLIFQVKNRAKSRKTKLLFVTPN